MKVTSKDVAKAAGVSQATASMVFRGKPGVSEATRQRVLEKAVELGFILPQLPAKVIQLVVFKRHGKMFNGNPFFEILIQGAMDQAMKLGYHPSVFYFYKDKNHMEQLSSMLTMKSAGIVLLATEMDERDMNIFRNIQVPMVLLDNFSSRMRWDSVLISNFYATREATWFLIKNGFKRLGYLKGNAENRNLRERYRGYTAGCQSLDEANAADSIRRVIPMDVSTDGAAKSMQEYLDTDPVLPEAFIADNDDIASGCCRALMQAGYRVPEHISVIGFDDSPVCLTTNPPLTTMEVKKERMGALAVKRLDERINNPDIEIASTLVMPQILIRGSVKLDRAPSETSGWIKNS